MESEPYYADNCKRAWQVCSDHGVVHAKRKVWLPIFYWAMVLVTFGECPPDYPYRCPKCGRLTTEDLHSYDQVS